MNVYALVIGIILSFYIIIRFKKTRLANSNWAYPVLLATFPVYYFAFAIYAGEVTTLFYEILAGSLFIGIAYIAFRSRHSITLVLTGSGSLLHAVYDAGHDLLFINQGTPGWWLEFCGSIDVILGIYLVYQGVKMTGRSTNRLRETA